MTQWDHKGSTIHGLIAEGQVFPNHPNETDPKPIRILLMPAGWPGQDPTLVFQVTEDATDVGVHQLINLKQGAALVELELADETRLLVAEAVERVAETATGKPIEIIHARPDGDVEPAKAPGGKQDAEPEAIAKGAPAITLALPTDLNAFIKAVEALAGPEGDRTIRMTEQQAVALYYRYWPMIVTHSVVAAAEGTTVLMVSLPAQQGGNIKHNAIIRLIESDHPPAKAYWPGNDGGTDLPEQVSRQFNIASDNKPVNNTGETPDDPTEALATENLEQLESGWDDVWP